MPIVRKVNEEETNKFRDTSVFPIEALTDIKYLAINEENVTIMDLIPVPVGTDPIPVTLAKGEVYSLRKVLRSQIPELMKLDSQIVEISKGNLEASKVKELLAEKRKSITDAIDTLNSKLGITETLYKSATEEDDKSRYYELLKAGRDKFDFLEKQLENLNEDEYIQEFLDEESERLTIEEKNLLNKTIISSRHLINFIRSGAIYPLFDENEEASPLIVLNMPQSPGSSTPITPNVFMFEANRYEKANIEAKKRLEKEAESPQGMRIPNGFVLDGIRRRGGRNATVPMVENTIPRR